MPCESSMARADSSLRPVSARADGSSRTPTCASALAKGRTGVEDRRTTGRKFDTRPRPPAYYAELATCFQWHRRVVCSVFGTRLAQELWTAYLRGYTVAQGSDRDRFLGHFILGRQSSPPSRRIRMEYEMRRVNNLRVVARPSTHIEIAKCSLGREFRTARRCERRPMLGDAEDARLERDLLRSQPCGSSTIPALGDHKGRSHLYGDPGRLEVSSPFVLIAGVVAFFALAPESLGQGRPLSDLLEFRGARTELL